MTSTDDSDNCIGRRGFLKSIFGLGASVEAASPVRVPSSGQAFVWADLNTGQIGFPTGLSLGSGQPGSLMKLVAAAALTEERLLNPNHVYACPGHISIGKQTFHCQFAHGRINLVHAIAKSCNGFFIDAAKHLPAKLFLSYGKKFGLDASVAARSAGIYPAEPTADSYMYVLGLAHDLAPNALQILQMSALIARRGAIPNLHSAEAPEPDKTPFSLELSNQTWSRLQEGMELACREGTSVGLDPDNQMRIAAKTGTAPAGKKFQSWVTGYFPHDAPRYAFCLYCPSGTSQDSAVPKAHEFLFATTWPI